MASLVILVSAVLVLSCRQSDKQTRIIAILTSVCVTYTDATVFPHKHTNLINVIAHVLIIFFCVIIIMIGA